MKLHELIGNLEQYKDDRLIGRYEVVFRTKDGKEYPVNSFDFSEKSINGHFILDEKEIGMSY